MILLLIVAVIVGVVIVPLRRIEEHEYNSITEPWNGGELRLSFAPSFTELADGKWPKGWKKGSPYRVSVMWISPLAGETKLRVEKIQIAAAGMKPLLLPPQEKVGADKNNDGMFYTIVAYNEIELAPDLLRIDLECSLNASAGPVQKRFTFEAKKSERTRWVHAVLESVMGI